MASGAQKAQSLVEFLLVSGSVVGSAEIDAAAEKVAYQLGRRSNTQGHAVYDRTGGRQRPPHSLLDCRCALRDGSIPVSRILSGDVLGGANIDGLRRS
ncbi:hypothetical protein KCU61_g37, partial [Aureobasidium melanogenum]